MGKHGLSVHGSHPRESLARYQSRRLAVLGLVVGTACTAAPGHDSEPGEMTLRIQALDFPRHTLRYDAGDGWNPAPGTVLEWEGSWRRYSWDTSPPGVAFLIGDGESRWYPSPAGAVYRISDRNVWLVEGLLYAYDPLQEQPPASLLTLMTLNLHTYQETNADTKLDFVVEVIAALQPDLVAFQECAQSRNAPVILTHRGVSIRDDNMAWMITQRLLARHALPYDYFWDWSHYGFSDYEEGSAVLVSPRHLIREAGSTWVSQSQSVNDPLNARKVVYARVATEAFGTLALVSAHLSWGDEQLAQETRTQAVLESLLSEGDRTGFIAGDFNAPAGDSGYAHMVASDRYQDAYIVPNRLSADTGFYDATASDGSRIDYIFQYQLASALVPILSQRVFFDLQGAGQDHASMQRVSDHRGVVVHFEQP